MALIIVDLDEAIFSFVAGRRIIVNYLKEEFSLLRNGQGSE